MECSVLEMLSDWSSAPTLLGCRPSGCKSLGRFQKRFQLLTESSFWSLHHDNNHLFKANSLLNLPCPRRYVVRGPDTIVAAGDVLHTISIRLLKSLFNVSVCRSLVSLFALSITTAVTLSSSFMIAGICTETSRTRAPGKQCVCTLPSATITALRSVSRRGAKRLKISKTAEGEKSSPGAWNGSSADAPRVRGFPAPEWRTSEKIATRVHGTCAEKHTGSIGGGSVSRVLHTYSGLVSFSQGCFQRCSPLPQLGLLPKQLADLLLDGLQLHRMQLERVLACTQR